MAAGVVTVRAPASLGRVRATVGLLGPAIVASVAYVDPGNVATNFSAGIGHGYYLVWVVVLANLVAVLVQHVTAKVGIVTGRSLPELCRDRYGPRANQILWVQAEVVAMATDIAEFVGAAVGIHLLFGMPTPLAGVASAVATFMVLSLDRLETRRFERVVAGLLVVVLAGIGYVLVTGGDQNGHDFLSGLVPRLDGSDTATLAVGIIGATVMPHAIYIHSAIQARRTRDVSDADRRRLVRHSGWDCVIGLTGAGLINLAMLCIAAGPLRAHLPSAEVSLDGAHREIAVVAGGGAALAFAVALIASGIASASVGTFAGQVVMAGFIRRSAPLLVRRAITMVPALVLLCLSVDTTDTLVYSQVILSFGIPFALVPLLLISRDASEMRAFANGRATTALLFGSTVAIIAANIFLLISTLR